MTREKTFFGLGLVLGIIIAALFLYYFAPRYDTVRAGDTVIKQDRWSGQAWRLTGYQWRLIETTERDWGKVDEALRSALKIPFAEVDTKSALKLLREKNPILKELSDDELLERIKLVYSRQILCNMYLDNFMKAEKGETGGK